MSEAPDRSFMSACAMHVGNTLQQLLVCRRAPLPGEPSGNCITQFAQRRLETLHRRAVHTVDYFSSVGILVNIEIDFSARPGWEEMNPRPNPAATVITHRSPSPERPPGRMPIFCLGATILDVTRRLALLSMAPPVLVWCATRSVKGTVSDQNGKNLPGAVVYLKDTRSAHIRSYIARKNGAYQFHSLSPDIDYELSARFEGVTSSTKSLSRFDSEKTATIDLVVEVKTPGRRRRIGPPCARAKQRAER